MKALNLTWSMMLVAACSDGSPAIDVEDAAPTQEHDASPCARTDAAGCHVSDAGARPVLNLDAAAKPIDSGSAPARCDGLAESSCVQGLGCRAVFAASIDETRNCAGVNQFVGCKDQGDGCSTIVTRALDPDGGRWQVPDSCLPPRWQRAPATDAGGGFSYACP